MKTRQGFVSNSSTTSFCIFGVYLSCDVGRQIGQYMQNLKTEKEAQRLKGETGFPSDNSDEDDEGNTLPNTLHIRSGDDGNYLGVTVNSMEEEETLGQFRKRIAEMIKETFENAGVPVPKRMVPGWHSDSYYPC